MINFYIIFGFLNLMLVLEALVDAFVYLAWTRPLNKKYGKLHHLLQPLLFLSPFIFGCYFAIKYKNNLIIDSLWLSLIYVMFRISILNKLYNHFSGENRIGNTDVWDIFCNFILNKIKKEKYYKVALIIFDVCRILLYISGIILILLKFL
jgi:hypothetical protein